MSGVSAIEWTDRVWNPVTGCQKVSPGCKHCYAEAVAHRFWATQYPAVGVNASSGPVSTTGHRVDYVRPRRFTDVLCHEERLLEPLSWRKPQRVFVNSMSDLFHEDVPEAFIDRVFAVMGLASHLTFQVLTKRPERMRAYCATLGRHHSVDRVSLAAKALRPEGPGFRWTLARGGAFLPNVWLGVSVEDQVRAEERVPVLLETSAAVRFVSAEPLLGPVALEAGDVGWLSGHDAGECPVSDPDCLGGDGDRHDACESRPRLDWVIVGGESGPGARPCALEWVERIVADCRQASVPVFVKQLGAVVVAEARTAPADMMSDPEAALRDWQAPNGEIWAWRAGLRHRKGGDPVEWPAELRVREFPG